VDFRNQEREHPPIDIDGTAVVKVESFKFLGVRIIDKLKWSTHTDSVVKKAQQCLFILRSLKKCCLSPKTLTNFYRCTIESILSGCIIAWYGNCTAQRLDIIGHFNKWNICHFNNATLIRMFTYLALIIISSVFSVYCIIHYLLHLSRSVTAHPYILYIYSYPIPY
jgi:hypothetical protein